MSKINELRAQRAKTWEQTKAFLDSHRSDKGVLSAEDTATYEQYYTDVNKYWWEEITKFVAGTESLDNWDSYVQHCKDMGQDKLLEVFLNSQK